MAFMDMDVKGSKIASNISGPELNGIVISNRLQGFTYRVFWYNVQQLLNGQGLYFLDLDKLGKHRLKSES